MISRNRPRGSQHNDDADEERSIWNQLRADGKKVDALVRQSNEFEQQICELWTAQQAIEASGGTPPVDVYRELDDLVHQTLGIHEEIRSMIDGSSSDSNMSIMHGLELLSALRAASANSFDSTANVPRYAGSKVQRNSKRNRIDHALNDDTDSMADSPKPSLSSGFKDRLGVGNTRAGSRSTSVGAGREASVKVEDGNDAMDSGKATTPMDRHRLNVGTEVFYRNKQKNTEGEGILCNVTSVAGDGKQRRYEIIDSDPDPSTPPQPYRVSVNNLVPISTSNVGLFELPLRRSVLAVYPGTTTFYKAEVVASRAGNGLKKDGKEIGGALGELREGFVRLRFEGEDEADREMDVERRYVLPESGR